MGASIAEEYASEMFKEVRQAFGVDELQYASALGGNGTCSTTNLRLIDASSAGGKSRSWFLLDSGMQYFMKTCSRSEANLLLELLPSYIRHIKSFKDTLLPRYYGLYHIHWRNQDACFLVMSNVFAGRFPIVRRFDLKGSTYGRCASAKERAKGARAVLKDLDLLELGSPFVCQEGDADRIALVNSIERDCVWLASEGLIDYSLLVGLATCQAGDRPAVNCNIVRVLPCVPPHEGGPNLVYLGIVDILTRYDGMKSLETLVLGSVYGDVSCQPPERYASRFKAFVRHAFRSEACTGAPGAFKLAWLKRKRAPLVRCGTGLATCCATGPAARRKPAKL